MSKTVNQFTSIINICRNLFQKKLSDYGPSWRIMRPESITDQIFIKAKRIKILEEKKKSRIDEDISSEFIAIVNYGIIGLIQLSLPQTEIVDISIEESLDLYDKYISMASDLMLAKNHDYGEAWRDMRLNSFTDLILMKICRIKQIEDNNGKTLVSEGIDANYMDMINYSIFSLIQLDLCDN